MILRLGRIDAPRPPRRSAYPAAASATAGFRPWTTRRIVRAGDSIASPVAPDDAARSIRRNHPSVSVELDDLAPVRDLRLETERLDLRLDGDLSVGVAVDEE